MMQINVNPATLTKDQREALAGFILTFPAEGLATTKLSDADVGKLADKIVSIGNNTPKDVIDPADNPATGALEPVEAFSDPVVNAFGGATPLPFGATAAPYTAVASASTTVPEVPQAIGENPTIVPLPPAPPSVPLVPTAAPTATNLAPADSANFPWDARIHSESKAKIANGTWKKKRGVDPALVVTVEQELAGVSVSATPTGAIAVNLPPAGSGGGSVVAPVDAWPFPTPNAPTGGGGQGATAVGIGGACGGPAGTFVSAPAQTLTVPNGTPTGIDPKKIFVGLIGYASSALRDKKLTQDEITTICAKYGIAALPLLANSLQLVEPIANEIYALVGSR